MCSICRVPDDRVGGLGPCQPSSRVLKSIVSRATLSILHCSAQKAERYPVRAAVELSAQRERQATSCIFPPDTALVPCPRRSISVWNHFPVVIRRPSSSSWPRAIHRRLIPGRARSFANKSRCSSPRSEQPRFTLRRRGSSRCRLPRWISFLERAGRAWLSSMRVPVSRERLSPSALWDHAQVAGRRRRSIVVTSRSLVDTDSPACN